MPKSIINLMFQLYKGPLDLTGYSYHYLELLITTASILTESLHTLLLSFSLVVKIHHNSSRRRRRYVDKKKLFSQKH